MAAEPDPPPPDPGAGLPWTYPGPDGSGIDPNAPAGDAEKWYSSEIAAHPDKYDDSIPKDVWLSWYGLWNPKTHKFSSIKQDASGKTIAGEFDKPTDCPSGTTAYGQSKCLPLDDPHVLGVKPGGGAAAPGAPATSGGPGDISYTGNPLVDMLIYQFNSRRSLAKGDDPNIFGLTSGRIGGVASRDQFGQPLGMPDITGRLLKGGGLWWAPAGTDLSVAPTAATPTAAAPPPLSMEPWQSPKPPPDIAPLPKPDPYVEPLVQQNTETPLQRMLRKRMPVPGDPAFNINSNPLV